MECAGASVQAGIVPNTVTCQNVLYYVLCVVQELLESGYLTEVHKFSKFIHGTCTIFPELVQAVPYWVDDESVRPSMLLSAPPTKPAAAGGRAGSSTAAANGEHVAVEVQEEVRTSSCSHCEEAS